MTSADHERETGAVAGVLITGGGSGIGAALAPLLAERGCDVLVAGRRSAPLAAVAARHDRISSAVGDVTDASVRTVWVERLGSLPGPRAVVHLAGSFQTGVLDRLSLADWRRSFEVNVEARWALSVAAAPRLERGRLLFIGSDAGANPRAGGAAYSIAQAGSETLRRALQAEWADRPIAVGGFKPGLVDTDMVRGFMALPPEVFPAKAAYDEYIDGGRVTTPAVIARFAAWLLLDVGVDRFAGTEWDVRDESHQSEWLDGPLYPDAR